MEGLQASRENVTDFTTLQSHFRVTYQMVTQRRKAQSEEALQKTIKKETLTMKTLDNPNEPA